MSGISHLILISLGFWGFGADVTGVTVGGRFGEGYSVTAVFGEGVTKKGRL